MLDAESRLRDHLFDPSMFVSVVVVPHNNAYSGTNLSTTSQVPSSSQTHTSTYLGQGALSSSTQSFNLPVPEYQPNNYGRGRGRGGGLRNKY